MDFDWKKRRRSKRASVTEAELDMARDKCQESKCPVESAMTHVLDNDTEHISQLMTVVEPTSTTSDATPCLILSSTLLGENSIQNQSFNKLASSVVKATIFKASTSPTTRTSTSFTTATTADLVSAKRCQPLIFLVASQNTSKRVRFHSRIR